MARSLRLLTGGLLALAAVYLAVQFAYVPWRLATPGSATEPVTFEIHAGEGVASISARLAEAGLVADGWAFRRYLARTGLDTQIQAGQFRLSGGQTGPQLAEQLLHGQATQTKLTLLEGWNAAEMDAALPLRMNEQNGLPLSPGAFREFVRTGQTGGLELNATSITGVQIVPYPPVPNLEGYLFPDTYFVDPNNFSLAEFVMKMRGRLAKKLVELGIDRRPMTPDVWEKGQQLTVTVRGKTRTLHELLTMASIVQLEERDPVQQKLVADILWRRLDTGMALGADATLFYILGHRDTLTAADLAIDSPYNTRRHAGLPPTPVAAPGASALTAAAFPAANDFWYYLHGSDGAIHFARDLPGHNANKARYLQP